MQKANRDDVTVSRLWKHVLSAVQTFRGRCLPYLRQNQHKVHLNSTREL
jgi:hypothetical protein